MEELPQYPIVVDSKEATEVLHGAIKEIERLEAINAGLLAALEQTVSDLEDVIRIVRVDKGMRGEWPRAETGLVQARAAILAAKIPA
ncbi:hypothetical protein LCGC14_2556610 [marine sediment metagenome]|uniref:Uncharacterized protein n=1 Tax=marine sediment metagenome TaxID=412755 RepID=A0A0F9CXK1_9ZZZZ